MIKIFDTEYVLFKIIFIPFFIFVFPFLLFGFSFIFHNFLPCLFLLFSFRSDSLKKRTLIQILCLSAIAINYFYDETYNVALILLCLNITSEERKNKLFFFLSALLVLIYPSVEKDYIQHNYGKITNTILPQTGLSATITNHEPKEIIKYSKKGLSANFHIVKDIEMDMRVVYIDKYDKLFAFEDYYSHPLYDAFSPLDMTIFIGTMADNWKLYKVSHERRLGILNFINEDSEKLFKISEWENLHIIPNNTNVYKGLKTVRRGDIVKVKGYLVDWEGLGDYKQFEIKTSRGFAEISPFRAGGEISFLCMQLYVTKLITNGYIYE